MTAQDDLWTELHELFDTDDGSLPEIVFVDPPRTALQPLFAFLMGRGTVDLVSGGSVYDPALEADVPIADVPDAGARVASGRIPDFHVLFHGIEVDGVTVPPLGACFGQNQVALDYRMGSDWNATVLAAFARLLDEMRALAPGARLHAGADGGAPEHDDTTFELALDRYLASPERHARGS